MRKIAAVLFVSVIAFSCGPRDLPKERKTIDSLQAVIRMDSLQIDSLTSKLRERNILIRFTAAKCHKYALIVKKNPNQSVFIVNWIDRSFQWIDE